VTSNQIEILRELSENESGVCLEVKQVGAIDAALARINDLEIALTKMYAWQTTVRKSLPDGLGDEVWKLIEHRLER